MAGMTHRWIITTAAAALAVTGLAACGGDDDDSSGSTAGDSTPSAADLVVEAVPTIRWAETAYSSTAGAVVVELKQSDPSSKHTLAIVGPDGTQLPTVLEVTSPGETDEGTYELAAGTYEIICTIPGHTAMKATLTVG